MLGRCRRRVRGGARPAWSVRQGARAAAATLAVAAGLVAAPAPRSAAGAVLRWHAGRLGLQASARRRLALRWPRLDLRLRLGGRLHLAGAAFDGGRPRSAEDVFVRRGRIYALARLGRRWALKAEYELAPGREGWRNLWLRHRPGRGLSIRVGNFVAPFSMAEVGSSNYAVFAERALPSALAPSYQTAVGLRGKGRLRWAGPSMRWTAAGAATIEPLGDADHDRHGSSHWGLVGRATSATVLAHRALVHVGASLEHRFLDGSSRYRVRSRGEVGSGAAPFTTGRLRDVDRALTVGLEAAALWGPLAVQAEYLRSRLWRRGRPDPSFDGWYVHASWVLTGEARRYAHSAGILGGVAPRRPWGAVEVGLRYSALDLNDETVTGGRGHAAAATIGWHLRRNLRLLLELDRLAGVDHDLEPLSQRALQVRLLVFF